MRPTLVGVALALAGLAVGTLMARAETSGAGLVVRHGDGRVVYRYVQFSESSISGLELLRRSGLSVVTAPYPGLGEAVCAIDGEGCPAEDCFCKSYGSPSFYWNYYIGDSGQWRRSSLGAASRRVSDGDVDGWSWTSGPPGLPTISIDEIAAMFGISRGSVASPQPTLPSSPTPIAALTPAPTVPRATPTTSPRARPSPSPVATVVEAPTATAFPSPGMVSTPTVHVPSPGPTLATPTLAVPSPSPWASPTVTSRAVSDPAAYAAFGVLIGLMAAVIGALWWRSRLG